MQGPIPCFLLTTRYSLVTPSTHSPMNLIIETTTGRPVPAGAVPQLGRGPDATTLQFVTNNVAALLAGGAPIALKLYTLDDLATPKATFSVWTPNNSYLLYEAVLDVLASGLAWIQNRQLVAKVSYGAVNVDTPLFEVSFNGGQVGGSIIPPIIINISGGGGGGGSANFVQPVGVFGGKLILNQVAGYWKVKAACNLLGLQVGAQTAPVGADAIIEVVKNGAPSGKTGTLTAGNKKQETIFGAALALAIGDVVEFRPTQIGSTTEGTNLSVAGVATLT